MKNILNYTYQELETELSVKYQIKNFVIKQIWNWIYCYGIKDFNEMNNVSKHLREELTSEYNISRADVVKILNSNDGTIKWLLELEDKNKIELVYIPSDNRGTLCISSQVGCAMGCKFCNTGSQGFVRNLHVSEIVGQILIARDLLNEWDNINKAIGEGRLISNIVIMGMGEPLINYDNIVKGLKIINNDNGIAFSNRRITISTCGVVPKIYDLAKDIKINLAISLHASNDETRKKIMPIAEKYTIEEIMKACGVYAKATNYRRITFEYIMIKNVNDSIEDANRLLYLVKKYNIPAKFNLIPFNPWCGCIFTEATSKTQIVKFAKIITDANYPCPIRDSRGQDIMAACGQLKSNNNIINKI